MRIVYGCNAQGQGHLSKAAVLVPLLEAAGHEVRVITSGLPVPPQYQFTWHRHYQGLPFSCGGGKTAASKTAAQWLKLVPTIGRALFSVRRMVHDWQPDLILSDFELLTVCPVIQPRCEVVSLCRQVALFDPGVPLPEEGPQMDASRKLTLTVVHLFTLGADRYHGYHYAPSSYRCVPPVVRQELRDVRPTDGGHLLVYNAHHWLDGGDTNTLLRWAADRRQEVIVYGHPKHPRGRFGTVTFRESSRSGMLADMASCKAVVTTAGLTTPVEASLLGKPCVTIPLPGQWEQAVNALHLDQAGLAKEASVWDYNLALELPAPTPGGDEPAWMSTTPDAILGHVLGRELLPAIKRKAA